MTDLRRVAIPLLALTLAPSAGASQGVTELPAEDRTIRPEPQELFRVGSLSGPPWQTFSQLGQVAFDADGFLYILDRENHRIVVVDGAGELVREMGREGDGPGEFRMPASMAVARDGRVAVFDIGHRAFVLFDPEGEYDRMVGVDMAEGLPGFNTAFHPDGSVISASGQGVVVMTRGPDGDSGPPSGVPIQRYSLEERGQVTTLHRAWDPPRGKGGGGISLGGGGGGSVRLAGMPQPRAFDPRFRFGVLPDGRIAFADTVGYSVKLLRPQGGVDRVLTRPFTPRPVTRRDQDRERERRLAELEAGEGPQIRLNVATPGGGSRSVSQDAIRKMQEERIQALEFAEHFPVIADMAVDWEGRLWVERTSDDPSEPGPVDVVEPSGRYLGTVPPDGLRIPDAFGPDGLLAYIETDELDVPSVVVRRLPPDWR